MLIGMLVFLFFFKQKTAYEMRISDWSSDVCSSVLLRHYQFAARRAIGGEQQPTAQLLFHRMVAIAHGILCDLGDQGLGVTQQHALQSRVAVELLLQHEIGRASCRERVCQYV